MGREMDEKMTTASLEKILKAKKAEERAIENAEMKMLYSAYVESGLGIEEAIQLLKGHKSDSNDCCGKFDNKSAEDIRQEKRARKGKSNESTKTGRSVYSPEMRTSRPGFSGFSLGRNC